MDSTRRGLVNVKSPRKTENDVKYIEIRFAVPVETQRHTSVTKQDSSFVVLLFVMIVNTRYFPMVSMAE